MMSLYPISPVTSFMNCPILWGSDFPLETQSIELRRCPKDAETTATALPVPRRCSSRDRRAASATRAFRGHLWGEEFPDMIPVRNCFGLEIVLIDLCLQVRYDAYRAIQPLDQYVLCDCS